MHRLSRLVAAVLLLGSVAACGGNQTQERPANAQVKPPEQLVNPGRLTIAADFQGAPFDYFEGTEKKGFDVEFDKAVAELMGLRPELVDARFASLVTGLEAGRYDAVVSVLYITKERAEKIDMVPYAQTGSGFLVRKNENFKPQAATDLCGRTVAVLAGGFEEQLVTGDLAGQCKAKGSPVTAKSFPSDVEATRDLAQKRSDVFFSNHSIVTHRVKQFSELQLEASNPAPLYPVPAGIGVRKDRPDVRRAFEEAIQHLRNSGRMDELLKRYGLENPDPELVKKAIAGDK
ncbi:lysine/arginine/ornithine ABC transporter substrate-binding protein ArgT [Actinomadura viridis]|uniref:ABC-type amino acid transport substrate-binding protein n=1 Tax=Actinomadura viridis TaxID=58110 RepID=A0A931DKL9_9ACTN|nr:ABC transporter substrate-binding protein [Actinomadura viridis]MBG6089276.1 ABC-type amino acid transport substrate-binding protein [Actinomadura viridis]